MAEKRYYWLKLKRDFFKRHDIRIIESMQNGKDYILFYLKLLLESVDHDGTLRFSETIPYNEDMLSVVTNTNVDIVRSAMKLFAELGMVEILDDSTIYMNEVQRMIGSETKWAEYKRNKKMTVNDLPRLAVCKRLSYEQILLPDGKVQYVDEKRYGCNGGLAFDRAEGKCEVCGSTENLVIHHSNGYSNELDDLLICCKKCHGKLENLQRKSKTLPTEIEIEKDIEIEKEKRVNYQRIADLYNETCVSFPRLRSLSESRKKAIKARLKSYSEEDFKLLFEKAEASDFLKGKNNRNWSATFDWLIQDTNMAKVLDGNYDENKGERHHGELGRSAEKARIGNYI